MNTIEVKFAGNDKSYKFSSDKKYPLGVKVVVQNTNGSKDKARVLACYEDEEIYKGKVLHEWKPNRFGEIKYEALRQNFSLSDTAYKNYTRTVTGNRKTTLEQATKKINRNIALSLNKAYINRFGLFNVHYGELKITIDFDSMTVLQVKNNVKTSKVKNWEKDVEMYDKLNEKFGIYQ